jgi:hypothetical protein
MESASGRGAGSSSDDEAGMISDVTKKFARRGRRVRRSLYCDKSQPKYTDPQKRKTCDGILELQVLFFSVGGELILAGLFGPPDRVSLFPEFIL